jgi:hypothetical protein
VARSPSAHLARFYTLQINQTCPACRARDRGDCEIVEDAACGFRAREVILKSGMPAANAIRVLS